MPFKSISFTFVNPRQIFGIFYELEGFFIKFHLASYFGLYFKSKLKFPKKFFHSFIDLGLLHFDLCENEKL